MGSCISIKKEGNIPTPISIPKSTPKFSSRKIREHSKVNKIIPKPIPQSIPQQISKHKKEEKKTKYKKKAIPKTVKKATWDKWIGKDVGVTKCLCCEHQEIRQFEFHCGHVIAESKGGKTTVDNMRPICAQCNLSMGSMDMNEFKKMYFEK
jgi:5-methylcytosine-specific restriction endonuclease McrA